MSDNTRKALSIVRREEENNANEIDYQGTAQDFNDNAELPGNNDAADAEEHLQNAENLAEAGANHGYTDSNETDTSG